jgi:hypothetical protein
MRNIGSFIKTGYRSLGLNGNVCIVSDYYAPNRLSFRSESGTLYCIIMVYDEKIEHFVYTFLQPEKITVWYRDYISIYRHKYVYSTTQELFYDCANRLRIDDCIIEFTSDKK